MTLTNETIKKQNNVSKLTKENLTTRTNKRFNNNQVVDKLSEKTLRKALTRIKFGELILVDEQGKSKTYSGTESHSALVQINDSRAWRAIALEGSVGLGRGYMKGWWESSDPVAVIKLLNDNIRTFDRPRNNIAKLSKPIRTAVNKTKINKERSKDKENIHAHYDIGNEFFKTFLDETMTYSAGVFNSANDSMKQASINKYDRILNKIQPSEESSILEIGTGWGGFAIQAAKTTKSNVTTTTISDEQFIEAKIRVQKEGLNNRIEVLNSDWRDLNGQFDSVVSIEMIEAVHWKDYTKFFTKIQNCLKPDGKVVLQAICVPEKNYERIKGTKDFIRHFIFPGGYLPSIGAITNALKNTDLQLYNYEDLSEHYVETLRRWRKKFNENLTEVENLNLNHEFQKLWDFYLAYCEAAFSQRTCTLNQITIVGPEWQPSSNPSNE